MGSPIRLSRQTHSRPAAENRWTYTYADDNPPHVRANPPAGLTVKSLDVVEVEFSMPVNGVDASRHPHQRPSGQVDEAAWRKPVSVALGQAASGEVNISWADNTGITGDNPFKKPFLPLGWFYRVDPTRRRRRASSSPRSCITRSRSRSSTAKASRCSISRRTSTSSSSCTTSVRTPSRWTTGGSAAGSTTRSREEPASRAASLWWSPATQRLAGIKEYKLAGKKVLGPYEGVLSNNGERVRVENAAGNTEDSVRYSAQFPWPIGADSIGAGPNGPGSTRWITSSAAARWSESTFRYRAMIPPTGCVAPRENATPGRPNHIARQRSMPLPIVTSVRAINRKGSIVISKADSVRIEASSPTTRVNGLTLEYFYDNLERRAKPRCKREMTSRAASGNTRCPRKPTARWCATGCSRTSGRARRSSPRGQATRTNGTPIS